ncbi:PREDICTED: uncharacterized protein LOC106149107 [Chinchilla lanigera]|uniref:uncharacterized protein LOC106149107 n=1 Tax=Chinchilla lanigera TaxID=34839 RepID=UPI000697FE5D|nr:PREDICTED: uncharacterized protein LOC106149107 [Chinchilla lanigera]
MARAGERGDEGGAELPSVSARAGGAGCGAALGSAVGLPPVFPSAAPVHLAALPSPACSARCGPFIRSSSQIATKRPPLHRGYMGVGQECEGFLGVHGGPEAEGAQVGADPSNAETSHHFTFRWICLKELARIRNTVVSAEVGRHRPNHLCLLPNAPVRPNSQRGWNKNKIKANRKQEDQSLAKGREPRDRKAAAHHWGLWSMDASSCQPPPRVQVSLRKAALPGVIPYGASVFFIVSNLQFRSPAFSIQ